MKIVGLMYKRIVTCAGHVRLHTMVKCISQGNVSEKMMLPFQELMILNLNYKILAFANISTIPFINIYSVLKLLLELPAGQDFTKQVAIFLQVWGTWGRRFKSGRLDIYSHLIVICRKWQFLALNLLQQLDRNTFSFPKP